MGAWQKVRPIYENGEDPEKFSVVVGEFKGRKVLGICWSQYHQNSPMIVDDNVRNIILAGLWQQAMTEPAEQKTYMADLKEAILSFQ